MREKLLISSESLEGKPLCSIHEDFEASHYGRSLLGQPRWNRYRPEHMAVGEWRKILGADADNVEHMKLTYGLMRQFIYACENAETNLSQDDQELLLLSSLIHDWGESHTARHEGGDKNWELKTIEDSDLERQVFAEVFDSIIGQEHLKTQLIVEKIIFEPDSRLGQIFNAVERMGYMRTAMYAVEQADTTEDEILAGHLKWLSAGVLSNQTVKLLDYAKVYEPVNQYLKHNEDRITKAFQKIDARVFTKHGQTEKMRQDMYDLAKNSWLNRESGSADTNYKSESYNRGIFGSSANFEARFISEPTEVEQKVNAMRSLGLKIVLTSGSFDLPHIGHARYVAKAHEYGDVLVVGVDSDDKIKQRKGPDRPIVPETERVQMLAHLRDVDLITLKRPSDNKWELIKRIRPDTLIATAETYSKEEIAELESGYCGRVIVLEPQATTSTSARIRRLEVGYRNQILGPVDRLLESHEIPEDIRRQIGEIILNARKNA